MYEVLVATCGDVKADGPDLRWPRHVNFLTRYHVKMGSCVGDEIPDCLNCLDTTWSRIALYASAHKCSERLFDQFGLLTNFYSSRIVHYAVASVEGGTVCHHGVPITRIEYFWLA